MAFTLLEVDAALCKQAPEKSARGGLNKGALFAAKNAEIFGMVPYVSIFLLVLNAGNGGLGMGLLG